MLLPGKLTAMLTHFPRPLQGLIMMRRRLCTSFFRGAAASRSSRTACAAEFSEAHTILALFSRRLQQCTPSSRAHVPN